MASRHAGDPRGFYEVLGIGRTASAEEIRQAFRVRAKSYHPDRAGPAADEARFHHLREAFETLRDPQQRMRYDALGRDESDESRRGNPSTPATSTPAEWWQGSRRAAAAAVVVLALLLMGVALLSPVGARLERRDPLPAEPASTVSSGTTLATPTEAPVYRAELVFPRGSAELVAAHAERAALIAADLRQAIAALPPDSGWTVMVAGQVLRLAGAAQGGSGMPGLWQLTIRRLAAASDYLARQGVPGERIAASFQAGPAPGRLVLSVPEAIQLTLVCCEGVATP